MTTTLPETQAPEDTGHWVQVGWSETGPGPRQHERPFTAAHERKWPRAGVRRRPDGAWALMIWAKPDVSVAWYANVAFTERQDAVDLGKTIAGAYRSGGVVEAVS